MQEKQQDAILERFRPFFNPKAIVIIGASRNEYTFNGIIVKNLLEAQYKGKIYLIHPISEQLMGLPCLKSLDDLQEQINKGQASNPEKLLEKMILPELAIIITQHDLITTVKTLAELHIRNILIETDVHVGNPEKDQQDVITQLKELIKMHKLQVMGPSMIGIMDFQHNFTSSIIPTRSHILNPISKDKLTEGISFLAQSGGLSGACGWWAPSQNPTLTKIIHIGDKIHISESEILEFLFLDPFTKVILLFIKHFSEDLIQILKKYAKKKPVLYKYVGKETIPEKNLEEMGTLSVRNYIELFEFGKVFLWCSPPKINTVGIIGPSSGAINLLLAEMRNNSIHLAKLEEENRKSILNKVGGSTCVLGNPVDFWPPSEFVGTQVCRIYHNASASLLKDQNVGGLFLALEFFTEIEFNFNIFENIKRKYPDKPIICILIQAEKEGADRIMKIASDLKIPVFIDEVERGVRAFATLINFYKFKQ